MAQATDTKIRTWPVGHGSIAAILTVDVVGPPPKTALGDLLIDQWIGDYEKVHEAIKKSMR